MNQERIRIAYENARRMWCEKHSPSRDAQVVLELAEVTMESVEGEDWFRAVRSARSVAREAAEMLGEPDYAWAEFTLQVDLALDRVRREKHLRRTLEIPIPSKPVMIWRP